MSGVCSRHKYKDPNCSACNCKLVDCEYWQEKVKEAESAGKHICNGVIMHGGRFSMCAFEFYLTTENCPLCGTHYKENIYDFFSCL
jgi:hypothetical protein